MEQIVALGLSVDDDGNLRLLPDDVWRGSRTFLDKARALDADLEKLAKRLAEAEDLLADVVEQNEKSKIVSIASTIANTRLRSCPE